MVKIKILVVFLMFLVFCCDCWSYFDDLVGKEVILSSPAKLLYIGAEKRDFNNAISCLMSNDKEGYMAFYLSNKVYNLFSDTKAVVLEVWGYQHLAKIKILEGPLKGKIFWVLVDQIDKNRR